MTLGQQRQYITLTPVYGRDYKSKKAILEDFNNERDFLLQPENQYINKQQITWPCTINFRYKQLRNCYVHDHKPFTPYNIVINAWNTTLDITILSSVGTLESMLLTGEFTKDNIEYRIGLTQTIEDDYTINIIENKKTGKQLYPPF